MTKNKTGLRSVSLLSGLSLILCTACCQQVAAQQTGTTTGGAATANNGIAASTPFEINTSNVANAPQGFVGANTTQESAGFVGSARQATTTNNANRQFRAINDQNTNRNVQSQQAGTPRTIPIALRLGFAAPSTAQSSSGFGPINSPSMNLFALNRPELSGIQVTVSEFGVATLSGEASSLETRRLAANLMRLQPGVRSVENKLVLPPQVPEQHVLGQ